MMTTLKMHSFQSDNAEVPRIYVFCLSAHEYGLSHGVWINAAKPAEEIQEKIEEMLANSPIPDASGFSMGDYEGFYSVTIDHDDCIKRVSEIALFIGLRPTFKYMEFLTKPCCLSLLQALKQCLIFFL